MLFRSDTVYYETDKKGKLDGTTRLSKIGKGDRVVILANDKDELQVVVVVTAYKGEDVVEPVKGEKVEAVTKVRDNVWITIGNVDYLFSGSYEEAKVYEGKRVEFRFREIDGDKVITSIEVVKDEPGGEDEPEPVEKVKWVEKPGYSFGYIEGKVSTTEGVKIKASAGTVELNEDGSFSIDVTKVGPFTDVKITVEQDGEVILEETVMKTL